MPKYDDAQSSETLRGIAEKVRAADAARVAENAKAEYDSMDARARLCQELQAGLEPLLDLTAKAVKDELNYASNETVNPEDIRALFFKLNEVALAVSEMQSRIYDTLRRM